MKSIRFALSSLIAAVVLGSIGCSTSSTSVTPLPTPIPRPNLYTTACSGTHMLDVFKPPFSASSVPAVTVPFPVAQVCVIAARLLQNNMVAVGTSTVGWYLYALPLTNTSVPTVHVATPAFVGGFAQDNAGNLLVSDRNGNKVNVFAPPFTNASTPTVTFTGGLAGPYVLDLNMAGDLFAGNCNTPNVTMFAPPFTNASAPTATITPPLGQCTEGIGLDPNANLYVGDFNTSSVWVYNPPYSNASTPVTTIVGGPSGTNEPTRFAFDSSGHVFIANYGAATITSYTPPLTGASTPLFTLHVEPQPVDMFFGP
jgi:hypothetical protein